MTLFRTSLLAASLAMSGTVAAQGPGYPAQGSYRAPGNSYGAGQGAVYDYARVLRVDPVIGDGYRGQSTATAQNCRYRQGDDVYTRDEGYNGYADRNPSYPGDGYYGGDNNGYPARGSEASRTVATVIGGIAGAVLGSKIGDGSGRYVGTAVGSMVGGMAGRSIYDNAQRNRVSTRRGTVRVCDPVPVGGYGDGAYRGDGYGNSGYGNNGYGNNGYYSGNENLAGYDVTYEYAGRTYQTRTDYHPGDRIRVRVDVRPE